MQQFDATRRRMLAGVACTGLGLAAGPLAAQPAPDWPTKPVRLIITFPTGGLLDIVSRMLAPKLSEAFGQQFVVENRPGANGNIGGEIAARSDPDGHTLLATSADMVAVNPHLYPMSFDPARDLEPITQLVKLSMMIVTGPDYPAHDATSLIARLKARPGQSYGTPGNGSAPHLIAETFRMETGTQITHVPYKGLAAALSDLMGGQIDLVFDAGVSLPNVRAGKLKLLAVAGKTRLAEFPDVGTLGEAGIEGFDSDTTFVLMAPAGTPPTVIDRVNAEVVRQLRSPEFGERLARMNLGAVANTPAEAAANLAADHRRLGEVIRSAGIRID
ncbi:MAG: tripartite tricarboxylate transporter substrate binding protein [Burkholderiaceae bacterium]